MEPFGFINPCKSGGDSYFGCTSAKHVHYHIRFLSAYSFTACLCQDWRKTGNFFHSSHWLQFHIQMSHINQIYAKWPFLHAHAVICMKNSKHYIIWNISFCSHLTINSRLIINFPNFDKQYKVRAVTYIALAGQWQPHTKKYNFLFFNFGMKTLFCIPWCVHLLYTLLLCTL